MITVTEPKQMSRTDMKMIKKPQTPQVVMILMNNIKQNLMIMMKEMTI